MKRYDPVGEITLGPRTTIAFHSDPIALPKQTCLVAFGPGLDLMVRVDEVDGDGVAHGNVIGKRTRKVVKGERGVPASAFVQAGLEAIQRECGPLA